MRVGAEQRAGLCVVCSHVYILRHAATLTHVPRDNIYTTSVSPSRGLLRETDGAPHSTSPDSPDPEHRDGGHSDDSGVLPVPQLRAGDCRHAAAGSWWQLLAAGAVLQNVATLCLCCTAPCRHQLPGVSTIPAPPPAASRGEHSVRLRYFENLGWG